MINLGLTRISRLLTLLAQQNCQLKYQPQWGVFHVAGTNGKGSVAAYLAALLKRTGQVRLDEGTAYVDLNSRDGVDTTVRGEDQTNSKERAFRVGRFTSPHFIDSWDCITVNDQVISREAFEQTKIKIARIARQVEGQLIDEAGFVDGHHADDPQTKSKYLAAEQTIKAALLTEQITKDARLTEFELLTATAFDLFSNPDVGLCDMAVIECGLGGRLDATNVIPTSAIYVSVITRIGLDHLNMLGGSLQSIIQEKCGILRRDVPVVVDADNDRDVLEMIHAEIVRKFGQQWAEEMVHEARGSDVKKLIATTVSELESVSPRDEAGGRRSLLLDLMPHQQSNLALAMKAYHVLNTRYISSHRHFERSPPSASLLEAVLEDASKSYPGRLQWLRPGWLRGPLRHRLPGLNASSILLDGAHNTQSALVLRFCVDRELTRPAMGDGVYDLISTTTNLDHYIATSGNETTATPSSTAISAKTDSRKRVENPQRTVIWILAMSSGKDVSQILGTLIKSPSDEIIFTSFGPVDGMPWVKPEQRDNLVSSAEVLDMQYNIKATVANIVDALDSAEELLRKYEHEGEKPIIVVAGSLYLVSDFLRFLRDGREGFTRHWEQSTSREGI